MKKTLIVIMLFSLAVAGLSFPALAEKDSEEREYKPVPILYASVDKATSTLERIPSPEYIKYFKMIKKDGDALYGIRIDKPEAALKASTTLIKATSTQNKLEKIAHPSLLNLYEKIQKIGSALWGIKKGEAPKASSTPRIITAEMSACVSAAIEKKDTALKARIETSNNELKSAIDVRTACQKTAISSTEKQIENIKVCNESFKKGHEAILKASKEAQKNAWNAYQIELRACGGNATGTAPIMIEDGGSNLMEALVQ